MRWMVVSATCAVVLLLMCSPVGTQPGEVAAAAGRLGLPAIEVDEVASQWRALSVQARNRIRCAGTRTACRSLTESLRVFHESIDRGIRRGGPSAVDRFLRGKDWSHIIPVAAGGGNGAANGFWEQSGLNRVRGARVVTSGEIAAAGRVMRTEAFRARGRSVSRLVATRLGSGALAGAIAAGVFTLVEAGVSYYSGHIDQAELQGRIRAAVVRDIGAGAAIGTIIGLLAPEFPFLAPVAGTVLMMITNELYSRYGDEAPERLRELWGSFGASARKQAEGLLSFEWEPLGVEWDSSGIDWDTRSVFAGTDLQAAGGHDRFLASEPRPTVVEFREVANPGGLVPDLVPVTETWKGQPAH